MLSIDTPMALNKTAARTNMMNMNSVHISPYSDFDLGCAIVGLILAHFIERYYRNLHQPTAAGNHTPCYSSQQYLFRPTI